MTRQGPAATTVVVSREAWVLTRRRAQDAERQVHEALLMTLSLPSVIADDVLREPIRALRPSLVTKDECTGVEVEFEHLYVLILPLQREIHLIARQGTSTEDIPYPEGSVGLTASMREQIIEFNRTAQLSDASAVTDHVRIPPG